MKKVVLGLVMSTSVVLLAGSAGAAEGKAPSPPMHSGAMHAQMKAGEAKGAMKAGEQPTCGQQISGMANMPEKMSEGAAAVADLLDAHANLMGKEKEAQTEVKGMRAIAKTQKQVAADLKKAGEEMKKATSWPPAPHDWAKMSSDPKLQAATRKVIDTHKEIIALLQKAVADMEAQMKAAGK